MIDWEQVRQLETDVGSGEFKNVVALFLDEVEAEMDRLRAPDPALDDLAGKMHALRGSAKYLGFQAFAELCEKFEALAEAGRATEIDISGLVALYEQSRAAFIARGSGQGAGRTG